MKIIHGFKRVAATLKSKLSSEVGVEFMIIGLIALGGVLLGNFWFWMITGAFVLLAVWIYERKDMGDSAKVMLIGLIFLLAFALYAFSQPEGSRSYIQETCPDCDQF